MEKINATVVIWGNDNYNVLGLLRQLTPYVEKVIFLVNGKKRNIATLSNCCNKYIVKRTIDEGLAFLLNFGARNSIKKKCFIITTSDLLAVTVDEHSEILSKYFILSNTKNQGILTRTLNKNNQNEIAKEIGFLIPFSLPFRWDTTINNIPYPCLIKPAMKEFGVNHPFKTRICHDEKELWETQSHLNKSGKYVLQQYIEKENDILIYGCRLENGIVYYAGSFLKYRWVGGDGSYGTICETIPNYVDTKKINSFLEKINYTGLFSAEFGVKNDKAWFYEFNLRNDGTSHYFFQAGLTNIPLLWIRAHIDNNIPEIHNNTSSTFIDEISDKQNVKMGIVEKTKWAKQRRSATVYKYYDPSDKLPYYYAKAYIKVVNFVRWVNQFF